MGMDEVTRDYIVRHVVGHLATADGSGCPAVVPICYVLREDYLYSVLDEKPKKVPAARLTRVRNIQSNPQVAVVIDDYSEDWGRLAYVHIRGVAELLPPGTAFEERRQVLVQLREKYPPYRAMALEKQVILKISTTQIYRWNASGR